MYVCMYTLINNVITCMSILYSPYVHSLLLFDAKYLAYMQCYFDKHLKEKMFGLLFCN